MSTSGHRVPRVALLLSIALLFLLHSGPFAFADVPEELMADRGGTSPGCDTRPWSGSESAELVPGYEPDFFMWHLQDVVPQQIEHLTRTQEAVDELDRQLAATGAYTPEVRFALGRARQQIRDGIELYQQVLDAPGPEEAARLLPTDALGGWQSVENSLLAVLRLTEGKGIHPYRESGTIGPLGVPQETERVPMLGGLLTDWRFVEPSDPRSVRIGLWLVRSLKLTREGAVLAGHVMDPEFLRCR